MLFFPNLTYNLTIIPIQTRKVLFHQAINYSDISFLLKLPLKALCPMPMITGPDWPCDEWLDSDEGAWQYIEINIVENTRMSLTAGQLFSSVNHCYKKIKFSIYLEYEYLCLNGAWFLCTLSSLHLRMP